MSLFPNEIVKWYRIHHRDLPWRNTKEPYVIWLSEIILQQTRVSQGLPYFETFIKEFPTVFDLAQASEEKVLRLWQGLGYYSRGRNLHYTAQHVVHEFKGVFPQTYKDLRQLKGVGEYTAAAIASFSYDERVPVIDGNVYRVLSRYFGLETPIDSTEGRKEFRAIAETLIQEQDPAEFNQAMMEFGALQCIPKGFDCSVCPVSATCEAHRSDRVGLLPFKSKKVKRSAKYYVYLVAQQKGSFVLEQRKSSGIWARMYTFPFFEIEGAQPSKRLLRASQEEQFGGKIIDQQALSFEKHVLTHQDIHYAFLPVEFHGSLPSETKWYTRAEIDELPLPKLMEKYFSNL